MSAHHRAVFAVNARSAADRDRYKFDIVAARHGSAPTRFDPELIVDP